MAFYVIALEQAFPKACFVLTVRHNSNEWYGSLTRFHAKLFGSSGAPPTYEQMLERKRENGNNLWYNMSAKFDISKEFPYEKSTLIRYYEMHNHMVKEYFRFKSNLLVLNVAEADAYKTFCTFLNVHPIHGEFPWENRTDACC